MATITSATTGDYGTGGTWVGGIAPVEGDKAVIACTGTGAETFSTNTAGYSIGATAITLTGTVLAGSYVIGEAVQFGSTDPNYYTITNWVVGTKVLTVSALIIAIPASATLVKNRGHVVTVAGTYIVGDDTTTAVTITGTLRASRVSNSSLTIKGDIQMSALVTATMDWGRLSLSDPIPSGITATLIGNYSAAMVNYKYGIFVGEAANFYTCGVARTRNTTTTSSLAASGTSVDVADATNWAVGDWIVFAQTSGTVTQHDRKQIATITPTVAPAATVTFTAVTYAHASGCPVGNFSSNVTVKSFNTTNPMYLCLRSTSTASNNRREINHTTFEYVGSDVTLTSTKVWVTTSISSPQTQLLSFTDCSFYNGNNSVGLFHNLYNTTTVFSRHAFLSDTGSVGAWLYSAAGTYFQFEDCVVYYNTGISISSAFSQGGQGATYRRCKIWTAANSNAALQMTNGAGLQFIDCQFHSNPSTAAFVWLGSGDATFTTCKFGSSDLPGTPTFFYVADAGTTLGQVGTFRFNDCLFGTPTTAFYKNLSNANLSYVGYVSNKNLDPLVQEVYTPNGTITRDNTTKISGVTSVRMTPSSATNALTFTMQVPAPTGRLVGVSGKIIRDTANTMTVTLSGLGITASTYTCSAAINTTETFSVSGTNATGTDGILTLTFSVTGASGIAWVDSVSAPQAAAIDFGEVAYWANALPVSVVTASFVSSGDIWNYLIENIGTAGSIGNKLKGSLTLGEFIALK